MARNYYVMALEAVVILPATVVVGMLATMLAPAAIAVPDESFGWHAAAWLVGLAALWGAVLFGNAVVWRVLMVPGLCVGLWYLIRSAEGLRASATVLSSVAVCALQFKYLVLGVVEERSRRRAAADLEDEPSGS